MDERDQAVVCRYALEPAWNVTPASPSSSRTRSSSARLADPNSGSATVSATGKRSGHARWYADTPLLIRWASTTP